MNILTVFEHLVGAEIGNLWRMFPELEILLGEIEKACRRARLLKEESDRILDEARRVMIELRKPAEADLPKVRAAGSSEGSTDL